MKSILTTCVLSLLIMFGVQVHAAGGYKTISIKNKDCTDLGMASTKFHVWSNLSECNPKGKPLNAIPLPGYWYVIREGRVATIRLPEKPSCSYAVEADGEMMGAFRWREGDAVTCKRVPSTKGPCFCNKK